MPVLTSIVVSSTHVSCGDGAWSRLIAIALVAAVLGVFLGRMLRLALWLLALGALIGVLVGAGVLFLDSEALHATGGALYGALRVACIGLLNLNSTEGSCIAAGVAAGVILRQLTAARPRPS